jgi:hypothetical protein
LIEKDFLISFFIALIVALMFYYVNLDGVGTGVDIYFIHTDGSLDLYLIEFGMIMPFILPLFFLFKIIKARPRRIKHG